MLLEQSRCRRRRRWWSSTYREREKLGMFCYFAINWRMLWLTSPETGQRPAKWPFPVVMVALFKWITYVVCSHPLNCAREEELKKNHHPTTNSPVQPGYLSPVAGWGGPAWLIINHIAYSNRGGGGGSLIEHQKLFGGHLWGLLRLNRETE